jgi:hypothetical protein
MRKTALPISLHRRVARPEHLVVEDAALDAAQEHDVRDAGHVDAGRQQVDRDRDLRERPRS